MRILPNIYSQRDQQWASQRLGTVDGTTIGQEGCYDTSFCMVAGYYGHSITPAQFDDTCTDKYYVDGNEATDDMLNKVFSDCEYVTTDNYYETPADLNHLKDLLSDPATSVILEVDFDHDPTDGIQTHFVVAVDCDGTNVTIADPWYGTEDPFTKNYGNNPSQTILKLVVYKGIAPEPTVTITQKELDQLRTDRDNNWNLYQEALKQIEQDKNEIENLSAQLDTCQNEPKTIVQPEVKPSTLTYEVPVSYPGSNTSSSQANQPLPEESQNILITFFKLIENMMKGGK